MPYFSSTIFVAVLVLAVLTALTGYFLFARAIFPGFVERAERAWTVRATTTFLAGVPITALLTGFTFAAINAPNAAVRVLGFVLAGASLGFTFAGTAGLAARVGASLGSPTDAGREWARVLRGGIVLEMSMLFPILGWFLITPIAITGGAGAATLALFGKRSHAVEPRLIVSTQLAASAIPASSAETRV